jgi:dipeptidyl aminopeptidase/acylaminoacyl peptidase
MKKCLATLAVSLLMGAPAAAETADIARLVELMGKTGFVASPRFSPDGSRIAFVSNLSGVPQVWTVPTAGGYPELVTAGDDPVASVRWSPDGAWLAYSLAPGGGMNAQVYLVRPDGTGTRMLTAGGKVNNFMGDFTRGGSALAIASNRRSPDAVDCYLVDLEGEHKLVIENRGMGSIDDTSADGSLVLVSRLVSRGSNDLLLVDTRTSKEILLTPHQGPGSFEGVLTPDGRTVYLATNKTTDKLALGRVTVKDGVASPIEVLLSREDAELDGLVRDDEGDRIALSWNVAGRTEMSLFDVRTGKERRIAPGPRDLMFPSELSHDGKHLVLTGSGANAPSDVFVLDLESGSYRQLTRSAHAGIDLARLVSPELVRYAAHDGLPLTGWLYRPRGSKGPGPVVMSFHGGPEGQERPSFNGTYQALIASGISVFAPNVRGSSGFGKKFVNLDNGKLRVDAVKDIKATIDQLVKSGVADPKRIGIMGGSYGGYMVMAGLADYPKEIAAGADLYGVVNFETFFKHTEPWMAAISTIEYGDPATEGAMLRELSPLTRVDRVVSPTIVLHGANDTNVPVVEAEQVVESLKKRNVPVKYVLFPDEGHGWRKTKNRVTSTVEIVAWFSKWLGEPTPSR